MPVRKSRRKQQKSKKSTEQMVYEYVCHYPGLCTYELSNRLKMSGGNVRSALTRLHKKGLVKFKFDRNKGNPRIKKLTYPVSFWEMLPKKLAHVIKRVK